MARFLVKLLYVTDRSAAGGSGVTALLERLSRAPKVSVQVREKETADRDVLAFTHLARQTLGPAIPLYVNRRFDIALAAKADGVHLPSSGLPIARVRANTPRGFRVGVSTHLVKEARARIEEGADIIVLGPIFDTPSKRSYGPALGASALQELPPQSAHSAEIYAIGGITEENLDELEPFRDRICGIAGIRLFQEATDLGSLVERIAGR